MQTNHSFSFSTMASVDASVHADQVPEAELLDEVINSEHVTTDTDGQSVRVTLCPSMTCEQVHAMTESGVKGDNRVPKFTARLTGRYTTNGYGGLIGMLARDHSQRLLSLRIQFPAKKAKASLWKKAFLLGNVVDILNGKRVTTKSGGVFLEVDALTTVVQTVPHIAETFASIPVDNEPVSAKRVAAYLSHNQLTDANLFVYVTKSIKKPTETSEYRTVIVVDQGGPAYIKAWGEQDVNWLGDVLQVDTWYSIQNLTFTSTVDGQGVRWEQFTATKELTKIRPLTQEEIDAQEPIPPKLLAGEPVHTIIARFQAVWSHWAHYICAICATKRNGQEMICEKCKRGKRNWEGASTSSSGWKWVWGGKCTVILTEGDVEDFVFSSKQIGRLFEPNVVADPSTTPAEKMAFLAQKLVSIEYWQGDKVKKARREEGDENEKFIKSITLVAEKSGQSGSAEKNTAAAAA